MIILIISMVVLAALLLKSEAPKKAPDDIAERLPIWKVEKDCILSKNGDVTLVYELVLPEIFTLSGEEYEHMHDAWLKAIKVLPSGTILHKQDWFVKDTYRSAINTGQENFLKNSSDRFFNEREYLSHKSYLMLSYKPSGAKASSSAYSNLIRKGIVPAERLNSKKMQDLLDSAGQFKHILSSSGFLTLRRLKDAEITGTEKEAGILEKYLFLEGNQTPVLRDISFKPDFNIGENLCQLFTLADAEDLPSSCSPRGDYGKYSTDKTKFSVGFASPLGQLLPVNHIYNQFLFISDDQKTLKRLEAKGRRLHSLSAYSRENTISGQATAEYLNEAISQGRQPIKAHFNLLCWTDQEEELKDIRNATSSALAQLGATPRQETIGAGQLWWAGMPGNEGDFPENETFDTFAPQATCFFNLETAYRSSRSNFGIRLGDRLTGVPVHVDISDEPMKGITTNRNKVVLGSSGSGKSTFMCHLLHSYVQQGAHCIVVDVGHSYQGVCKLLKGQYFTYSEQTPICFNPFYLSGGEVLDIEKKESIKTLLVALWKHTDESFRRSEYIAISNALQSYYLLLEEDESIFPGFDSFYEFLQDQFVDELLKDNVKDRDFDVHNFLYVLRPYYKGGEFDYLLNARENLDLLHQPFIVFELDNVKDHPILLGAITVIITEMFISKMRKLKGIRKVIVIEEAWKAIANAGMAEFIKYLYKTVRKHFGEAITVTQEVDDVISSPIVKETILNSSDCKILLDMKKFQNDFEKIQVALGMTDKGKEQVLSLNKANDPLRRYREVYIELGNQLMKVYRYEPSVEEYYAYSTEETEKLKLEEYTERYGDIHLALRVLAAEVEAEIN